MTTGDLDVKAILERAEKATPGPWVKTRQEGAGGYVWVDTRADVPEGEACILEMQNTVQDEADAAFIAAARADVPALCAEVDRLRGEVAGHREDLARYFEHLSRVQVGVIDLTGMSASELYSFVASWIRNGVDVTWAKEVAALAPTPTGGKEHE